MSRISDHIENNIQQLRNDLEEATKLESEVNDRINSLHQLQWNIRADRNVRVWLLSIFPIRYRIKNLERMRYRLHQHLLDLQARADVALRPGYPWTTVDDQ